MRNFLQTMDDAYDLGYKAFKEGTKCPYDPAKEEAEEHQWQCGKKDAERDSKKEKV
jgi:hypothetical protein